MGEPLPLPRQARVQSHGTLLLSALLTQARQLGYHSVMSRVGDSNNLGSRRLHESLGFSLVGIEREVGFKFGCWLDVVVLQWMAGDSMSPSSDTSVEKSTKRQKTLDEETS